MIFESKGGIVKIDEEVKSGNPLENLSESARMGRLLSSRYPNRKHTGNKSPSSS
jgi:hypothetical protein